MSCQTIRFGHGNITPLSSISASPYPLTDLDNLKNYHPGRQAVWHDPDTPTIVITGFFPDSVVADFIALPNHNLQSGATVLFELFENGLSGADLLGMDACVVDNSLPLGVWASGVDVYGLSGEGDNDGMFIKWFDGPIEFRAYRITITHGLPARVLLPATTASQDPVTGILSMDSSDAVISHDDGENKWITSTDVQATEGTYIENIGPGSYDGLSATTPRVTFTFHAHKGGLHDMYLRVKGLDQSNFYNLTINGETVVRVIGEQLIWAWLSPLRMGLIKDGINTVVISPHDPQGGVPGYLSVDKLVIQPIGFSPPELEGPERSVFGYISTANRVSLRMIYMGRKLMMDKNFSFGNSLKLLTNPDVRKSASGKALIGVAQSKAKSLSVTLSHMTDADKIGLAMMETSLLGSPFIVSAYPGSAEWIDETYTMLANFSSALDYSHMMLDKHQTQLDMLEA